MKWGLTSISRLLHRSDVQAWHVRTNADCIVLAHWIPCSSLTLISQTLYTDSKPINQSSFVFGMTRPRIRPRHFAVQAGALSTKPRGRSVISIRVRFMKKKSVWCDAGNVIVALERVLTTNHHDNVKWHNIMEQLKDATQSEQRQPKLWGQLLRRC